MGYLDEIPVCVGYEIDGEVTTEFPTTAKLEKAKPVLKTLTGMEDVISVESRITKIFQRTAVNMWSSSKNRLDSRSPWFLMDREEMILFTDNLYRSVSQWDMSLKRR